VHGQTTGKHGLTKLTMARKPPPSPLLYSKYGNPNVILSQDSQMGSLKILEIKTPATLEAHNFFYRPPIEMRAQAKL
jgi:hypothetical protein